MPNRTPASMLSANAAPMLRRPPLHTRVQPRYAVSAGEA